MVPLSPDLLFSAWAPCIQAALPMALNHLYRFGLAGTRNRATIPLTLTESPSRSVNSYGWKKGTLSIWTFHPSLLRHPQQCPPSGEPLLVQAPHAILLLHLVPTPYHPVLYQSWAFPHSSACQLSPPLQMPCSFSPGSPHRWASCCCHPSLALLANPHFTGHLH